MKKLEKYGLSQSEIKIKMKERIDEINEDKKKKRN